MPFPTPEEDNDYKNNLLAVAKNGKVGRDEFVATPAWFDNYQMQDEEENTNTFQRALYLKELLFYVNKEIMNNEEQITIE